MILVQLFTVTRPIPTLDLRDQLRVLLPVRSPVLGEGLFSQLVTYHIYLVSTPAKGSYFRAFGKLGSMCGDVAFVISSASSA